MKEVIAVIGMGYVGLPLAHLLSKKYEKVVGFDINSDKIKDLKRGIDPTNELSEYDIKNTISAFLNKPFFNNA